MRAAALLAAGYAADAAFSVSVTRPSADQWKRTQCGSPSGTADIPTQWGAKVTATEQPLQAFPRPQMVRGDESPDKLRDVGGDNWVNLNGLWEWEAATSSTPPINRTLAGSILVPYPVESCLSGVAPKGSGDIVKNMWYRLQFDAPTWDGRVLLHFGAVDWMTGVYVNGVHAINNTGGYNGFEVDITAHLKQGSNELLVSVYDPSDSGAQPNGKQRISAIDHPGGDTYTPNSGIWQTVWLENVPKTYISSLKFTPTLNTLTVTAEAAGDAGSGDVTYEAIVAGKTAATGHGKPGEQVVLTLADTPAWSPASPNLHDLKVTYGSDSVTAYFGLRIIELKNTTGTMRPYLNSKPAFFAGFLDQSWWPDGQYTAPSDAALEYDLTATKNFGLNMIRLHQKINPERWYYFADKKGLAIFQDMVQKYGGASDATIPFFVSDMKAAIQGRGNHPCIVQWETFNEGDCYGVFKTAPYDVPGIVKMAKTLDPSRLVDTDSGGGANNLHIGDVNDIHSYPYPGNPQPSATQYAMVGEFGGIGAFIAGKEWVPGKCHTYKPASTAAEEASIYIGMAQTLLNNSDHISACVYTQTTDLELECDGFLNYDRSAKFSDEDTAKVRQANLALINSQGEL